MTQTIRFSPRFLFAACVLAAVLLTTPALSRAEFELQLLHASDMEAGADAVADAPRFAAVVDHFDDTHPNTVILASGDLWIPGVFLNAGQDRSMRDVLRAATSNPDAREGAARADMAMLDIIGFQASAFGNHEFDKGPDFIADTILPDIRDTDGDGAPDQPRWLGASFPFLAANLDFSGSSLATGYSPELHFAHLSEGVPAHLPAADQAPKIVPAALIDVNGETIGVVGATTPMLERISSPGTVQVVRGPESDAPMARLAAVLQPAIDRIAAIGVDKIILLSHLQHLGHEQALTPLLRHVDIVVAGGSNTLLADDDDTLRPGDVPAGPYPIATANADGDPALIVNTPGGYRYVGRLIVAFDDRGVIIPERLDTNSNGAWATTDAQVAALWGDRGRAFAPGSTGARVKAVTDGVERVIVAKDSETWGWTDVFLNGERFDVRTQQTNLGVVSAKANLAAAREADDAVVASIKNGGGIRGSIGEIQAVGTGRYERVPPQANALSGKQAGQISTLDIENALPFNNDLTVLTLSAADLLAVLEHGVATWSPGRADGRFPQVAGVAFSFDPDKKPGERIRSLALVDETGAVTEDIVRDGRAVADGDYRVVTLAYLAGGGDGYPFPALGEDAAPLQTAEQEALQRYLTANHPTRDSACDVEDEPMAEDTRIQNLSARQDTVLGVQGR